MKPAISLRGFTLPEPPVIYGKNPTFLTGFTLVELLIVVCIFSILTLGLGGVLSSGIGLWQRAWAVGFSQTEVLLELEGFSRRLRLNLSVPAIEFLGQTDRIEFPALIDNSILKLTYIFDPASKEFLCRETKYEDVLAQRDNEYTEKTLFSADSVNFTYLVFDEVYLWKDSLEETDAIPVAVKVNIVTDGKTFEKLVFIPVH